MRNMNLSKPKRKGFQSCPKAGKKGKGVTGTVDDMAFVVDVRSKTVITALTAMSLRKTFLQTLMELYLHNIVPGF